MVFLPQYLSALFTSHGLGSDPQGILAAPSLGEVRGILISAKGCRVVFLEGLTQVYKSLRLGILCQGSHANLLRKLPLSRFEPTAPGPSR